MEMENNQILMREKLGFFGILAQALTILYKNPKFMLLTFLTSFPLFCFTLIHETIFQHAIIQTAKGIPTPICHYGFCEPIDFLDTIKYLTREKVPQQFLFLGLLYLGAIHLLDLTNTAIIVNSASEIYAGQKFMNLNESLRRPIRGPFITSMYALLLASLTLLGLASLGIQVYISYFFGHGDQVYINPFAISVLFAVVFFLALLTKYMEWSAIWNMGIVISILDNQKRGHVALGVSAYLSRGSRRRGLLLMAVFFVWKAALRILFLHVGWNEGGSGIDIIAIQVWLVCVWNVIKWVVFMVYFYDCKRRFLEKKVDVENGRVKLLNEKQCVVFDA